jgi:dCMP deaminase
MDPVNVEFEHMTVKKNHDRQKKWDIRFLELCKFVGNSWSKDPSTKVASVIVRDMNRIVSIGYNGYPKGVKDDDSLNNRAEKYQKILHSEVNALLMARQSVDGYTIYVYPLPPCSQCAAKLIQSGISRVVSVIPSDEDRKKRWLESNAVAFDMFKQVGIELSLYNEGEIK